MYRWIAGVLGVLVALFVLVWKDGTDYQYLGPTVQAAKVTTGDSLAAIEEESQVRQNPPVPEVQTPSIKETQQTITGLIIDSDSGRPIKGARVWLTFGYGAVQQTFAEGRSDGQGRYRMKLSDLTSDWNNRGKYPWFDLTVHSKAMGYFQRSGSISPLGRAQWRVATLSLPALKKKEISGQVVDAQGLPVAAARISRIVTTRNKSQEVETLTDAAGYYRLQATIDPDLSSIMVLAEKDGFPSTWGNQTVVMKQGCRLIGRVIDERGKPLRGIVIAFESVDRELLTDKNGSFQGLFSHGSISLSIREQGFASFSNQLKLEGDQQDLGDLILTRGETLAGRIENEAGQPLAGVEIYLGKSTQPRYKLEPDAISHSDGRFRLRHLATGTIHLRLRHADYKVRDVALVHEGQTHQLVLQQQIPIIGRIHDEFGQPVPLTYLNLLGENAPQWTLSDFSGSFRFNHVQPGLYEVRAEPPGCQILVKQLEITAGETSLELNLEAIAETYLEGRVLLSDGEPARDGTASLGLIASVRIDGEGFYRIGGLKPGSYLFVAHGARRNPIKFERFKQITLRPGGNRLDISLIDSTGPRAFLEDMLGRIMPSSSYNKSPRQ